MASVVGVCNRALQLLGATRIASLGDATKSARECNTAYEPVRDALLRRYNWAFAISRVQLAADSVGPSFGPTSQYTFPADALRIILPTDYSCDWVVEGRKILTSWAAPLDVRYVKKIEDPNTMDALFQEAAAAKMAYDMCEVITSSTNKQGAAAARFKDAIAEAYRSGAAEKLPEEQPESSWITVRD